MISYLDGERIVIDTGLSVEEWIDLWAKLEIEVIILDQMIREVRDAEIPV